MSIGTRIESPQWKAENQTPISWRVSIVGCGPRGLYCLERILHLLQTTESKAKVIVDVFEPARFPGAGFIYDPNQPHHLRMNFANKYIDARHRAAGKFTHTGHIHHLEIVHGLGATPSPNTG